MLDALRARRDRAEADIRAKWPAPIAEKIIAAVRTAAQAGADSLYDGSTSPPNSGLHLLLGDGGEE